MELSKLLKPQPKKSTISDRLLDAGATERGAYKKVRKANLGSKGENAGLRRQKADEQYNANVDKTYNDNMTRAQSIVSNIDAQEANSKNDANLIGGAPAQPTPSGMSIGDETFLKRKRKEGPSVAGSLGIA
jgi:hypothetical protein